MSGCWGQAQRPERETFITSESGSFVRSESAGASDPDPAHPAQLDYLAPREEGWRAALSGIIFLTKYNPGGLEK